LIKQDLQAVCRNLTEHFMHSIQEEVGQMKRDTVIFKGTKGGLVIILDGSEEFAVLTAKLREKLKSATAFFKDARVIVNIAARPFDDTEIKALQEIIGVEYGLKLLEIINEPEANEETEDFDLFSDGNEVFLIPDGSSVAGPERTRGGESRLPERKPEDKEAGDSNTLLVKRTLRSGQHIRYDGSVAVLGDVNPGAEVIASGDIVVLGSFRGVAHAGATGNPKAIVAAFRLNPTQLRIANIITRSPDGDSTGPATPEIARVKDGKVIIEAFWMHGN
jgi:septum site-determining protein MinC